MRLDKLTAGMALAAALALPSGAALAGVVTSPFINDTFILQDDTALLDNCATVDFGDQSFSVDGEVTGVASTGETVTTTYDGQFVDRVGAGTDKGAIRAGQRANMAVTIDDGVAPVTFTGDPDKCRVQAKVKDDGTAAVGRVTVRCDVGADLSNLLNGATPPDAAEVAIIQDAYTGRNDIKLSGNGARIKQKGTETTSCP